MAASPPPSSPVALGEQEAGEKTGVRSRRGRAKDDPGLPEAVRRFVAGEVTARDLAKERGVSKRAIYKFLLSGLGDEKYADVITEALTHRIADADEALEEADSMLEVSKWSQLGKFARMDFERKRPALYGAKPVTVNFQAAVVDAGLAESMQKLLDRVAPVAVEKLVSDADAG